MFTEFLFLRSLFNFQNLIEINNPTVPKNSVHIQPFGKVKFIKNKLDYKNIV